MTLSRLRRAHNVRPYKNERGADILKKKKITNSNSIRRSTRRWGLFFLGPVVAAFTIGFVWPFLQGIWLSMCSFKTISNAKFIGLGNYAKAFSDVGFRHAAEHLRPHRLMNLAGDIGLPCVVWSQLRDGGLLGTLVGIGGDGYTGDCLGVLNQFQKFPGLGSPLFSHLLQCGSPGLPQHKAIGDSLRGDFVLILFY